MCCQNSSTVQVQQRQVFALSWHCQLPAPFFLHPLPRHLLKPSPKRERFSLSRAGRDLPWHLEEAMEVLCKLQRTGSHRAHTIPLLCMHLTGGDGEQPGPWGQRCTAALRFSPWAHTSPAWPAVRRQLPAHPHSKSYPAFFPPGAGGWPAARAAGLHLGRNMERGGCRRWGPPSLETTRPSVQHSAPLAAVGSEEECCIPGR